MPCQSVSVFSSKSHKDRSLSEAVCDFSSSAALAVHDIIRHFKSGGITSASVGTYLTPYDATTTVVTKPSSTEKRHTQTSSETYRRFEDGREGDGPPNGGCSRR